MPQGSRVEWTGSQCPSSLALARLGNVKERSPICWGRAGCSGTRAQGAPPGKCHPRSWAEFLGSCQRAAFYTRTAGGPSAGFVGIRKRHPLWADQLGKGPPPGAIIAQGSAFFRPLKALGTNLS